MSKCKIGKDLKESLIVIMVLIAIFGSACMMLITIGYITYMTGFIEIEKGMKLGIPYYFELGFHSSTAILAILSFSYLLYHAIKAFFKFIKLIFTDPHRIKRFFIDCEDE
jgi:hypothetical protein